MMGKVRRIDWHPADWLAGTRGLGWDKTAVYITVINIIYDRGEACPNDPTFIAGHLREADSPQHRQAVAGETKRAGNAIAYLIKLGKLKVSSDNQWLTNGRALAELGKAENRIDSAVRAGVASGAVRRAAPSTTVQRQFNSSTRQGELKPINGLVRTLARNHQPPYESSLIKNSTDAAREPSPEPQASQARAQAEPEPERRPPAPSPKTQARLGELAAAARRKLMGDA